MSNCTKCTKEIHNIEYYMFNSYCSECWDQITTDERKRLPGFCTKCGNGRWHQYEDGIIRCGICGANK